MTPPRGGSMMSARVYYQSGVAAAEATMERKNVSSLEQGRPGGSDRNNFVTNRVTVADYDDARTLGGAAAVGVAATWACVRIIAGAISSLPVMVYRTAQDGAREVAKDHPLYSLLHDSPNAVQTSLDFWDGMVAAIELQGNAYAEKDASVLGGYAALTPVTDKMIVRRSANGLVYRWHEDGRPREVMQDGVLHIRGPGGGMLGGLSTLSACAGVFGGAVSTDRAARATFRNGIRPAGGFQSDERLTGPQREELDQILAEKYQGAMNSGRPLLLDGGLKWQAIAINPIDAELLASRKFSGEEICRIFGVPPAMVGFGDKSSNWGTGKEVDVLGFIKFTLRPRLKRIELALQKQLLTAADVAAGITIEFNLEGLLRGDSAGRAAFYNAGINGGWLKRNEVRRWENLPPVTGGDEVTVQMQQVPLGAGMGASE